MPRPSLVDTTYPMDMLEKIILDAFRQKIYTPEYIREILDTYRKHMNKHGSEDRQKTKKLEAELKEIEQAEGKIYEAIEKGILELDDRLKGRVRHHKTRREAITAELATLHYKRETPLQTLTPQKIKAAANVLNKRFSISTPFSHAYMRATIKEIRVTGDFLKVVGDYRTIANLIAANGQIDPIPSVRRFIPSWRAREDLNLWPLPSEGSALSS